MEKIGNMQITDNKENKFFCFPMISMTCTGYRGAGFVGYLAADPDIYVRRSVHGGRWFSVFLFFAGRREPEQCQQQERQAFFDAFFHGGSGIVVAIRNIGNKSEFAKSRIIFIFASQSQKR